MEQLKWFMIASILGPCLGTQEKLFVKYGVPALDPLHVDSFFELQRTRSAAEGHGWELLEDRLEDDGYAVLCRNKDFRLCQLFDGQGSVAGLRIAISVDDVKQSATPYPMELIPMQEKKRIFDTDVYAATLFFVDDGVLKSGGRSLTEDTKTAPNGMYFQIRDSEPRYAPGSITDLEGTPYRRQGCKEAMGLHYFYNMTADSECGDLETFAPVYDEESGDMVAALYLVFGRSSFQQYGRRWFQAPPSPNVKQVAPQGPECLPNWVDSYGLVALHIYVHNEPWLIHCSD